MSLINFAYSDLGCSIHCDAVSVDGYEIKNIIEGDKGFMTPGFIKPPVDIILSFPYWIELYALDLSPKVSAQCTQVASVFVSEHEWDPSKSVQLQNYFKPCITLNSLSNIGDNIVRLSRSRNVDNNSNNSGGPSYAQMNGFNQYSSTDEAQSLIAQLPHDRITNIVPFERNTSVMHKVKAIKIRLQKSLNAGSLALKQVRIWATYSRHNPPSLNAAFEQALQQHRARRQAFDQGPPAFSSSLNHLLSGNANNTSIQNNMNNAPQPSYGLEDTSSNMSDHTSAEELNSSTRAMQLSTSSNTLGSFHVDLRSSSMTVDSAENSNGQRQSPFGLHTNTEQAYGVPEKFLDPITFHLMVDPVVLPSKHVVDRSTITRHLINHGTDPFTGLPMTAAQVLPDLALKADLDRYNSQRLLQQLTLSSNSIYATRLLPNTLFQQSEANSSKSHVLGSVSLPNLQLEPTNYSNMTTTPMNTTTTWLTNQNSALPNDHVACNNGSVNAKSRGVKRRFDEVAPDMEDVYEDEERSKRARPARLCGRCSRDITWGVSYPCNHLTCRGCVTQVPGSNLFTCPTCSAQFKSHELQRVHLN